MKTAKRLTGIALAATAATLFSAAPMNVSVAGSKGHCMGVNACKGMSACKTANSACKGHNACKGTGFVVVDEQTCEQLGGTFEK